jgi:ABC-2 type transport system permease protein
MKRYMRSRSRIIGSLGMPMFFLLILGFGLNSVVSIPGASHGYTQFIIPGIVAMSILFTSVFSGIQIIWDRQFGFLKEILVAPVSRVSIVMGKVVAGMTMGIIQAFLILGIAILLGVHITGIVGILESLVFIILISMSFVSMGIAFASRMEDMQGFQLIMNFLIMPIWILSGAFFPLEGLPGWLSVISHIDPLTYGVDGLRSSLVGISQMPWLLNVGVLAAFSVAMIGLGTYMFRKTEV